VAESLMYVSGKVREPRFMSLHDMNNPALKKLNKKYRHPLRERSNWFKDAVNFEDYISVSGM
jgi:hypothetical protein